MKQQLQRLAAFILITGVLTAGAAVWQAQAAGSPDINRDGRVDVVDLSMLLSNYGKTGLALPGDIDSSGSVGIIDLSMLLSGFGSTPSPGTAYNAVTQVATPNTYYATFQSHNQRVVANSHGIFMSWLQTWSGAGSENGIVRVARSTDGGKTFQTLLDQPIIGHYPGTVETDNAGNVYVFITSLDWKNASGYANARMFKFTPEANFLNPTYATLSGGGSDKFTSAYDAERNQLYYVQGDASLNGVNKFFTISTAGTVTSVKDVTKTGQVAYPHYPHLQAADGKLLLAWTNTALANSSGYYDVRFLVSQDGGQTWLGRSGPVALPVVADENGPSFAVLDAAERTVGGYRWLAGIHVQAGKLHFTYGSQSQMWYKRFDWAAKAMDRTVGPGVTGGTTTLQMTSSFFTGSGTPGARIFLTSGTTGNRIGTLQSDDNGTTWKHYALSDAYQPAGYLYAIAGGRRPAPDGSVIGAVTDQGATNRLMFIKSGWR